MDKISPISEVRSHLPGLVKSLGKHPRNRIIVTKSGRPAAVLLSPEELESLEVMADKDLLLSILRAEEDAQKGRLLRHDELFRH